MLRFSACVIWLHLPLQSLGLQAKIFRPEVASQHSQLQSNFHLAVGQPQIEGQPISKPPKANRCTDAVQHLKPAAAVLSALSVTWVALCGIAVAAQGSAPVGSETRVQRSALLDNAKFLLIGPVILTHGTPMLTAWSSGTVDFIRFHTTGFCLLSGVVSQCLHREVQLRSLAFRLLAPLILYLVVLEPLFLRLPYPTPEDRHGWPAPYAANWLDRMVHNLVLGQSGAVWYLFALINWRCWAVAQSQLRPWVRPVCAVVFSALCGCISLGPFHLNQAAQLFPIFVVGQMLPWDALLSLVPGGHGSKLVGATMLCCCYIWEATELGHTFMATLPDPSSTWPGNCSVSDNLAIWVLGQCKCTVFMTKALVLVLLCCPRSPLSVVTEAGQHTLYPFLMHYSVLTAVRALHHHALSSAHTTALRALQQIAAIIACYVLAAALSALPVRLVLGPFLEPRWLERLLALPLTKASATGPTGEGQDKVVWGDEEAGGAEALLTKVRGKPGDDPADAAA